MPKKPIKYGIKVVALCCAYTDYLLGFEVYLGKYAEITENSALKVVDRLIYSTDLIQCKGRILYLDKWYTSIGLVRYLYETYCCLFVRTVVVNDSKDRNKNSVPFRRLSAGALKTIDRGRAEKRNLTCDQK